MGSWPHDTVVDALVPTVEDTPFPATVVDQLAFARARRAHKVRRRPNGWARHLKVLALAALVLALVSAFAFGVLGRDTAVGGVQTSAMTDQRRGAVLPIFEPALETIPLGDPWFSAPVVAPDAPPKPGPKARPRHK